MHVTIYSMQNTTNYTVLIGIPLDLGAKNLGVDIGPDAFRHQGIISKLSKAGINVEDKGDIKPQTRENLEIGDNTMRYADEIIRVSELAAAQVNQAINDGKKVIAVGGDHSLNLGVVAGASVAVNGNLGLIYLDAHGDMNTPETSETGNIHGMHLAALMGFGPDKLVNVHGIGRKISPDNLLHIGGSDLDQPEIDLMKRENIANFTLFDLLCQGMGPLLKIIDDLSQKVENIWVSMDLDVIDRMYAPGAGMPSQAGLSYREISALATYIGQKCNVIGVDVVEYNPLQDENKKTAELGIELIAKFFGKNYSWYTNYLENNRD